MNLRSAAIAAINTDPATFIRYELADDASVGRKGEYCAVYSGERRELQQIDRATQDQLARDGFVKAGPFDPETRTYIFHRTANV